MERTIHRAWYWVFLRAYVICYITVAGLFTVFDAFANLDEFAKRADDVRELAFVMGRYYVVDQTLFVRSLFGVVAVMAGIHTLVWKGRQKAELRRRKRA
jgi:lipopolysaccharide export system permease protein